MIVRRARFRTPPLRDVRTHVNSGNVLCRVGTSDAGALEERINLMLFRDFASKAARYRPAGAEAASGGGSRRGADGGRCPRGLYHG